jgi:hypothetical protein
MVPDVHRNLSRFPKSRSESQFFRQLFTRLYPHTRKWLETNTDQYLPELIDSVMIDLFSQTHGVASHVTDLMIANAYANPTNQPLLDDRELS